MGKKKAQPIDIDVRLIEEIEAAALRWYGFGAKTEHMQLGQRFLAYLKGKAVFQQIDEYGNRYEPPTCGTAHLTAERSLRIIESATRLGESISSDAIDGITGLVEQAGIHFARMSVGQRSIDDDCPF